MCLFQITEKGAGENKSNVRDILDALWHALNSSMPSESLFSRYHQYEPPCE